MLLSRSSATLFRNALSTSVAVMILVAGAACGDDSAGPEAGFTVGDVASEPERLVGKKVTVSGKVVDNHIPGAFILGDGDGETALVLIDDVEPPFRVEGSAVRVAGTVESLPYDADGVTKAALDRLADEIKRNDYKHVIVATEVTTIEKLR